MMRVLITGATGFIGTYLTKYSSDCGALVLGVDTVEPGVGWAGTAYENCDVRDRERLKELLAGFAPDRIFHLAAQSYPVKSIINPYETVEINAGGTINLFEAVRAVGSRAPIVVASSSAQYGRVVANDLPVREEHLFRPLHPYGVSKVAQELLAAQYYYNYSIPARSIRIFNTTGPGKVGDVCSDLARRAIEIEMGLRPPVMPVGNLSSRRALLDVRDMVRALWLTPTCCLDGEAYNVGGSQVFSVQDIIELIRARLKIPFAVKQDPALVRSCDEQEIAGDTAKFRSCSDWAPEIDLIQTMHDLLEWWRNRLSAKSVVACVTAHQGLHDEENPPRNY